VTVRDPDFKMVQLRANGLCVVSIGDAEIFLKEVIGTDSAVEIEEITELLRRVITLAFSDLIMETGLGVIDLQGRQVELSEKLREFVADRVDDEYGLEIDSITMNISLPDEVTQAMTRGVARGVEEGSYVHNVGDAQALQQVRTADATLAAAQNPGGIAGDAMGLGLGLAMANQMTNQMGGAAGQAAPAAPAAAAPPPLPAQQMFHIDAGNGQQAGPYGVAQIQQGAANGQVTTDTLVWTAGMAAWTPAGQVPALAAIFAAPPPMPPGPPPSSGDTPPPAPPSPPAPPAPEAPPAGE
jgi:membrane protease subunit (stomatin/prohibitin family)